MGFLPLPEMTTTYSVGTAYACVHGKLEAMPKTDFTVTIDAAENNIAISDYLRPLVVTGVPANVRALLLNVMATEGEYSDFRAISYFATHFDISDGSVTLLPSDLLERDPKTWLSTDLKDELLEIDPDVLLGDFSLHSLAAYISKR